MSGSSLKPPASSDSPPHHSRSCHIASALWKALDEAGTWDIRALRKESVNTSVPRVHLQ